MSGSLNAGIFRACLYRCDVLLSDTPIRRAPPRLSRPARRPHGVSRCFAAAVALPPQLAAVAGGPRPGISRGV
jgi:hypothetical protein